MACKHLLDYANDVHLFIYHSTYVILIRYTSEHSK